MQTFLYTLSSSELLNLKDTPIEVVPPQGEGFYITPFIITLRSHYGTSVYGNLTSALKLLVNGDEIFSTPMPTTLLGNAYDCFATYMFSNSQNSNILKVADCDNQGIYVKNIGLLNLSGGDGTLDVQISCDVNPTDL